MQRVQYLKIRKSGGGTPIPGAYALRHDRPLAWLQRLCIATLKRLGCEAISVTPAARFEAVNSEDLASLIQEQIDDVYSHTGYMPKRVLMGNPQFMRLARTPEPLRSTVVLGGGRYYAGLEITVVPWMDGVLVLPHRF